MFETDRRRLVIGAASLLAAGLRSSRLFAQGYGDDVEQLYGPIGNEPFPIEAVDLSRINPRYLRAMVEYDTAEPAGTIVIDPAHRFLYLTDGNGRAMRYGVGVGRQGFAWSGTAMIHDKREWPDWYPPKEMLARDPSIMQVMQQLQGGIGMPGGLGNPLGARAMYLFQNGKDTLYRIHGTIEPWTIGSSISSGCIRMINQDVIDLYARVPVGTTVVVLGNAHPMDQTAQRRRIPRIDQDQPDAASDAQDPMQIEQPRTDARRFPFASPDEDQ